MGERKAVTKHLAESYRAGGRVRKGQILDELVELTGWHRDHARAVCCGMRSIRRGHGRSGPGVPRRAGLTCRTR